MLIQLEQARHVTKPKLNHPVAKSARYGLRLNPERDIRMFEFLQTHRIADRPLLQELFFGAKNLHRTLERLKKFYDHGYIERIERPGKGPAYRLARKGAEVLAESRGISAETIKYWGRGDDKDWHPTRVTPMFVDHMLLVAKLRLLIEEGAEKAGAVVGDWLDHVDLQPTWKTERVEIKLEPTNKWEEAAVTPDAAFTLTTVRGKGYFFLEADRGTETPAKTWQRKIKTYAAYLASGKFHKKYETGNQAKFRVVIAAPSVKRAVNIIRAAERYAPEAAELFLATAFSQINDDLLAAPIWARGGHTAPQALL